MEPKTAKEYAQEMEREGVHCNCDLDNWQPERITGHSCVCRIHTKAMALSYQDRRGITKNVPPSL